MTDLSAVRALAEKIASELNMEIVDVEFKMINKEKTLTIYVYKKGLNIGDCEAFHNAIYDPIDEIDFTNGASYNLNISSPGLDRPFKTARDYERNMGEKVEIKLFAPDKGEKLFEGVMTAYDGNTVTISTDGGCEKKFEITKIAKICLAVEL